jgi:hypothetical protein
MQRKAYNIEQGGEEEKIEEEEEGDLGEKIKIEKAPVVVVPLTPLDRARSIATSLCIMKGLPVPAPVIPTPVVEAPQGPQGPPVSLGADGRLDNVAAMTRARAIAFTLATGGKLGENFKEEDLAAHFSEELDINDYPPQVYRYIYVYVCIYM